jgi:hypothetical protein
MRWCYLYDGHLTNPFTLSRWLFVTEEDIKSLPGFQNQTLIAVKAPHGTTLEVPDPDEVSLFQRPWMTSAILC